MRFPRMHIAQSTVNRIFNTVLELGSNAGPATEPPMLPNTAAQSVALDLQLKAPTGPVAMPQGAEGAIQQAALEGDDLVTAATGQALTPGNQ